MSEDGNAQPARPRAGWLGLHTLDWVAIALLATGIGFVASGLLPLSETDTTMRRVLPILVFLFTVIPLAELTAAAEVFDVIAAWIARTARGSYPALFVLCVALASFTTITLNLDTTAVLLTPVMLALAARIGGRPLPLAMTTVWLANTASLLLPVSNLTNVLAAGRIGLPPVVFAHRMALPQLAAILATMLFLWLFYWRRGVRGADRYPPPDRLRPRRPVLFAVCVAACLLFVVGILVEVPLALASSAAAAIAVAGFLAFDRRDLRWGLIPVRLLVFVTGLFLVMQTIGRHGLDGVLRTLIGTSDGTAGLLRAAGVGAGLSNVLNNLPAYLAGEAVVSVAHHDQVLALLIGTNVAPIITPWASLATLIWYERCRSEGVTVSLGRLSWTGACLAVVGLAGAVGALLLTR
ncbi:SLC13 family permease [Rugosimonospora africana]|uniref:Arsenic transporter n=1 Tax=Rugosimonospora africana TaxID=556532 RepID=A0A8J3QR99_9ACTN|nr:SLC13 family permease [Rugosimonospora africana]GIH13716.1 arsenic transporter [Rugosimonospora africana]